MAEQVLDIIDKGSNVMENIGTAETIVEVGGLGIAGTTAVAGAVLDKKKSSFMSRKVIPTNKKKRRRQIARMRSYTNKKVNSCGRKLNNFAQRYPRFISFIVNANIIFKLICYWLDVTSDVALTINLYQSTNALVQRLYYSMVFFLVFQFGLGWYGLNLYFRNDLYKDPEKRLNVDEEVAVANDDGYYGFVKGTITTVNDNNTYNWKDKHGKEYTNVALNKIYYSHKSSKAHTKKELKKIRNNRIKRSMIPT